MRKCPPLAKLPLANSRPSYGFLKNIAQTTKNVLADYSRLISKLVRCIIEAELGTKFGSMPCGSLANPHIPGSIFLPSAFYSMGFFKLSFLSGFFLV